MKNLLKGNLAALLSVLAIVLLPVTSADGATKPKAAGRTAASIPNTILSGFGAPSNVAGIDGDFYIDVKNLNIYGPKIKNKWPAAVSLKGSNGSNGTDGKSGSDGKTVSNASLVAGPVGTQGAVGATGVAGEIGSKGDQGLRGEVGATGAQGIAGPTGIQGPIGLTGITGSQGPAGSGSQGAPGATGASGAQGSTGATGSQGPAGSGATGAQGSAGPTGATGATGSVGATGSTGVQGATGPTGLTGAQGSTGAAGAAGAAGTTGLTGNVGATGAAGATGLSIGLVGNIVFSNTLLGGPSAATNSLTFLILEAGKSYVLHVQIHLHSAVNILDVVDQTLGISFTATGAAPVIISKYFYSSGTFYRDSTRVFEVTLYADVVINGSLTNSNSDLIVNLFSPDPVFTALVASGSFVGIKVGSIA